MLESYSGEVDTYSDLVNISQNYELQPLNVCLLVWDEVSEVTIIILLLNKLLSLYC